MKLSPSANAMLRQWGFEIFCVFTASCVLVAMSIVLFVFDSKPVFDGRIVTLNAIVSTLSTASRVSLLAMLASAISQWNWIFFTSESRRLVDFEYLAAASRGPLGSVVVLLNTHITGGWVVRIGALVTVLTIALDPFAQQLVQLEEEPRSLERDESQLADIKIAHTYARVEESFNGVSGTITVDGDKISGDAHALIVPDYAMEAAIMASFTDPSSGIFQEPSFNCSSGTCEFEPYESLSVCSRCDDVSPSLKNRTKEAPSLAQKFGAGQSPDKELFNSTEYYLPNGLYINNVNSDGKENPGAARVWMTMFGTGDRRESVNMQDMDTLIWSQSFIMVRESEERGAAKWPGSAVLAYECELHYCVKEFTGSIKNGTLEESYREVDKYKRDPHSWQWDYEKQKEMLDHPDLPEWTEDHLAFHPVLSGFSRSPLALGIPPAYERNFSVGSFAVWGNNLLMKDLFSACIDKNDNCTEENQDASFGPPNGFMTSRLSGDYRPKFAKTFWEATELNSTFESISKSMTTAIRNGAEPGTRNETNVLSRNGTFGPPFAIGKVIRPVAIYKVVWPWIALHGISTLGGLVFLVLTIRFTVKAGLPAWKSSELAIFAQAAGMERIFDGDEKQDDLEKKAKNASVRIAGGKAREESEPTSDERSEESEPAADGRSTHSTTRLEESRSLTEGNQSA